MKANSTWAWIKKYGLWILIGLGVVLYLIVRFLPSDGKKPAILEKAKKKSKELKAGAVKELKALDAKMEKNRKELEEIKAVEDEDERLKRLADFANRR